MTSISTNVSRRSFVKASGALGALAAAGGLAAGKTMFAEAAEPIAEPEEEVYCSHCTVNCGSTCMHRYHVRDGAIVYTETDNTGSADLDSPQLRACLRGRSIRRWIQSPDRLNYPMKRVGRRGEGKFEQISWEEAIDTIVSEMKRIYKQYGPEAFYIHQATGITSSMMFEMPVLTKLLSLTGGYLNFYGDYSAAELHYAMPFMYGDTPGSNYESVIDGQTILLFGQSPADTHMGGNGQGHNLQRMIESKRLKMIYVDYRKGDSSCNWGGEWIPIRPGTDAALASALAYEIITNNWADEKFLHDYCVGYDEGTMPESAKGQHKSYSDYILGIGYDKVPKTPKWASEITLIPERRIKDLARKLHEAPRVFVGQGYGIQRRANGEMSCLAIAVLPQLLGQIGLPGTNAGGYAQGGGYPLLYGMVFPLGDNPVTSTISMYTYPKAIQDGPSMTPEKDGLQGTDRLSSSIKFFINNAGNSLTNQHGAINEVHDILADDSLCEFIVGFDIFCSDSMKYADILLPDLAKQEEITPSVNGYSDCCKAVLVGEAVPGDKFERRATYDVCCEIADAFGVYDEYSEGGKTAEEWNRACYELLPELFPDDGLPTWDELREKKIFKLGGVEPLIALEDFRNDPIANPLGTPSGKIEIYSEALAKICDTWVWEEGEEIAPIPIFTPGLDSYLDCSDKYPLQISAFHYKTNAHSYFSNNEIIRAVAPTWLWINPADAAVRGIEDGDDVRVFNDMGEVRIRAYVTNRIVPGTVAMPTGNWHDADMYGDRIDYGGCINTLTSSHPSPLAKGNPSHSNIGQVEKVGA